MVRASHPRSGLPPHPDKVAASGGWRPLTSVTVLYLQFTSVAHVASFAALPMQSHRRCVFSLSEYREDGRWPPSSRFPAGHSISVRTRDHKLSANTLQDENLAQERRSPGSHVMFTRDTHRQDLAPFATLEREDSEQPPRQQPFEAAQMTHSGRSCAYK